MKTIFTTFIMLLMSVCLYAQNRQTTIKVSTPGEQCKVALISKAQAGNGQYGWWSAWQELKANAPYAPHTFKNVAPGEYTLVVYLINNSDSKGDGMALEKIQIGPWVKNLEYSFLKADFVDWNCLSCPWMYVCTGKEYVKQEEVLQDVTGYDNRTTTISKIDRSAIIDGKIKLRIQEEKDEVSHIDQVALRIGNKLYYAKTESKKSDKLLKSKNDKFLQLTKGESVNLEFDIPKNIDATSEISLEVFGYYVPDAKFMADITAKLLAH